MKLYNSLTRKKEVFTPLKSETVSLYVCGITPNNATHLGHAFTYVSFDILVRFLTFKGYHVTYLQNATDINDGDDVIKQAREAGKTWEEIADKWIHHFKHQMSALHVLEPTYYVKASSAIQQIIAMNKMLIKKGVAYENEGNVYFDVTKSPSYGALCRFTKEQMLVISKERGNDPDDAKKKNPLDFVLWIHAEGKPYWESPWGTGRPGWHIECSAMIYTYLGAQIDIHGGGRDLVFPHHESEGAQSENYTDKKPYVKTWMHTAMVLYQGEKMSKSLGNLVLVEDLLKKFNPFVIRWTLLSHHYRDPWEFREEELEKIDEKIETIQKIEKEGHIHEDTNKNNIHLDAFMSHMEDDMNTPKALDALIDLSEKALHETNADRKNDMCAALHGALDILGFKA